MNHSYIGRSSNGRTEAFEAFNLGSIPSLPAKRNSRVSGNFLLGEVTELLQSREDSNAGAMPPRGRRGGAQPEKVATDERRGRYSYRGDKKTKIIENGE